MVSKPLESGFGTVSRCQVLLEKEISISIKPVSRWKHKVLQNLPVDSCIDFGLDKPQWNNTSRCHSTPNNHWLQKLHTGLQATWILCHSSLTPDSRPWFPNEMQHLLLSEKRTLDFWVTVQLFFSFVQVRCFWRYFCFRSSLVALFLKMSERGNSWCTDSASVYSLLSSPNCLNRLCLTVFSSLRSSLLLVHLFLPNFFLPVNLVFNMLWYSTPWTATPFSNDPLWLILCGGCQWSSSGSLPSQQCFPLLWFQRTRDTHNLYCMDAHLLKLKCKYSNILRYWIFYFHEL